MYLLLLVCSLLFELSRFNAPSFCVDGKKDDKSGGRGRGVVRLLPADVVLVGKNEECKKLKLLDLFSMYLFFVFIDKKLLLGVCFYLMHAHTQWTEM